VRSIEVSEFFIGKATSQILKFIAWSDFTCR